MFKKVSQTSVLFLMGVAFSSLCFHAESRAATSDACVEKGNPCFAKVFSYCYNLPPATDTNGTKHHWTPDMTQPCNSDKNGVCSGYCGGASFQVDFSPQGS
jgi:hypothetical protein